MAISQTLYSSKMDGDAIRASFHIFGTDEVEVIGNIHDNPELLEGGASE